MNWTACGKQSLSQGHCAMRAMHNPVKSVVCIFLYDMASYHMYSPPLMPMIVPQRIPGCPLWCLNSCMFAKLCKKSVKLCCEFFKFILPANAKGIPNPVAMNGSKSALRYASNCDRALTHEAPVSYGEESCMWVEGQIRPWAFGIMEGTGTLDLRGGKSAAGNVRRRQSGSGCVLAEHLTFR